ncbi:MAG: YihY/virulence factor BrkB family protein [Clostridiales bacterium]|jgi:membrane protein|nr:YihY/virulence factor BrkB family protein [Clostridiales bacterium]MDR2752571.1 YihY/virulence factor BrkB family protein [Clostridiales bacterium]
MKFLLFIARIGKEAAKDDLFAMASQLTYKILLAFFPFLIFLISLLGFLNLDQSYWTNMITGALPGEAASMINDFISGIVNTKNAGVLSLSLLVTIYNASAGFSVAIHCINQTYGFKYCRSFIKSVFVSVLLMLLFTLSLTSMLVLIIFNDAIMAFLQSHFNMSGFVVSLFNFAGFLLTLAVLIMTTMLVYKLSLCKKNSFMSFLPGAMITVICWVVSSKVFNIYVNNFAKYSNVYGSIAGIFILIMWLNLISTSLLIGSEINSMLDPNADPKDRP